MTTLVDLRERLLKAEGPDRKLDAAIAKHFGLPHGPRPVGGEEWLSSRITASIDASLSLGLRRGNNPIELMQDALEWTGVIGWLDDFQSKLARGICLCVVDDALSQEQERR